MSTKGYIGIVFLGISSVLSISTDGWKDAKDAKDAHIRDVAAEKARKEVSDQLTDQLKRTTEINATLQHQKDQMAQLLSNMNENLAVGRSNTSAAASILDQTTKLMQPIKSLKVSFAITLPSDLPGVQSYVSRIDRGLQPMLSELSNPPYSYKGVTAYPAQVGRFDISPESELYPNEADDGVTQLANDDVFTVAFYVSPEIFARVGQTPPWDPGHFATGPPAAPDIHILINTPCKRGLKVQASCHIHYEVRDHQVLFVVINADVPSEQWHSSGQIRSVPEILNSSFDFSWYFPVNDHPPASRSFATEVKSKLRWVSITTPDGVVYSGEHLPLLQGALAQYGGKVGDLLKLQ